MEQLVVCVSGQPNLPLVLSLTRARPAGGDNRNDHWSLGHSPVECITSSSNGLHGNHLYASIPGYAIDQPLALTKSSLDTGLGGSERSVMAGPMERQQVWLSMKAIGACS